MRILEGLAITVLCVLAACLYGIIHDQVTVRVCLEYFTLGHPDLFHTTNPTLLGFCWGIAATWWVGLPLGIGLAVACLSGDTPIRRAKTLLKPLAQLLVFMWACAFLSGLAGWILARNGLISLEVASSNDVPPDKQIAFMACYWTHSASYLVGFFGGLWLICRIWTQRKLPLLMRPR